MFSHALAAILIFLEDSDHPDYFLYWMTGKGRSQEELETPLKVLNHWRDAQTVDSSLNENDEFY
jgi:hypothetical protein